jgi:lipoxygenase
VKAIVTLKHSDDGLLTNLVDDGIQKIEELVGKTLVLELVSNELDQGNFNFYISNY